MRNIQLPQPALIAIFSVLSVIAVGLVLCLICEANRIIRRSRVPAENESSKTTIDEEEIGHEEP